MPPGVHLCELVCVCVCVCVRERERERESDCISHYLAVHVCVPKWGFCLWLPVADTRVSSTVPERVSPGAWRTKPPELVLQGRAERVEVTGRRSSAGAADRCSAHFQPPGTAGWRPPGSREPGGQRAETAGHVLPEMSPFLLGVPLLRWRLWSPSHRGKSETGSQGPLPSAEASSWT